MTWGGAERMVLTMAGGARAHGHEVALVARTGSLSRTFPGAGFDVPELRRRPYRVPLGARAVDRAVRAWSPDIVHAHNPGMALATAIATRGGRRPPALVSVHGMPSRDYRSGATILRLTGMPVLACGQEVAEHLSRHGCRPAAVVENAVTSPPPPADRAALEREWGLAPGRPMIVAVGRLVAQKNHRLAVRALAHVENASLVIVGEGPLRGEIEAAVRAAGLSDRIRLVGARDDAREIIGAADALVLSSVWEGMPLVVLEAMSAGVPVVSTTVNGLRGELARDSGVIVVEQGDDVSLGRTLQRVVTEPDLRARLSAAGLRAAADRSADAMIEHLLAVYEELNP